METAIPADAGAHQPARAYRLYVLIVLTLVYTFNFIDRQIMGILAPSIQADLGLSDSQLGVLIGIAFAVLYTTLGIPIARLADNHNRVTIISVSLALWSGFTALSGFAQNFAQLALARVGVGIGEAGGSPPSHSLISDLYPKEQRAGALAVYALGIPIGVTLAYLASGWVLQTFDWRTTFLVVGLPGVALAILVKLSIREPERGVTDGPCPGDAFKTLAVDKPEGFVERAIYMAAKPLPARWARGLFRELAILWRAAKHLLSIDSYRAIVVGLTAGSFASYALAGWIVNFFRRSHADYALTDLLFWLGAINGTAYVLGVFVGGNLVDRLSLRDRRAYGYVPAIALTLSIPAFLAAMWVNDPIVSLIFWWPFHLLIGFYLGPCFALAQTLAPVSIRALSTAIFFFILNMVALGFGPTVVGFLSDMLAGSYGDEKGLRIALSTLVIAIVISVAAFVWLARCIDADWASATGDDERRSPADGEV